MKHIAILLFTAFIAGCNTTKPIDLGPNLADERDCTIKNGTLEQVGHFTYVCTWPSKDSGKVCSDSRECEGVCEIPKSAYDIYGEYSATSQPVSVLKVHIGDEIKGVCSSIRSKGKLINCSPYVSNGKVTLPKCIG